MSKGWKIFLVVLAILVFLFLAYLAWQAIQNQGKEGAPPPTGLAGVLGNLVNSFLQPKEGSGNTSYECTWWKKMWNTCSDYSLNNCDPDRKGYNKNGVLDPSCGGGTGACNPFQCDPNREGYNMCGDKGFPCD